MSYCGGRLESSVEVRFYCSFLTCGSVYGPGIWGYRFGVSVRRDGADPVVVVFQFILGELIVLVMQVLMRMEWRN